MLEELGITPRNYGITCSAHEWRTWESNDCISLIIERRTPFRASAHPPLSVTFRYPSAPTLLSRHPQTCIPLLSHPLLAGLMRWLPVVVLSRSLVDWMARGREYYGDYFSFLQPAQEQPLQVPPLHSVQSEPQHPSSPAIVLVGCSFGSLFVLVCGG